MSDQTSDADAVQAERLARRLTNRKLFARGWPAGALDECVRLEREHPGWWVTWTPDGYCASPADVAPCELRRNREVISPDPAELTRQIAAAKVRAAEEQAQNEALRDIWRD
jgi:hypothetical protein